MSTAAEPDVWVTTSPRPLADVPRCAEPEISFVFVTFGTGAVVVSAIASLVASLRDEPATYEVIVVDNEHPTRTKRTSNQLLLDTAGVRVIRPHRNLGFGGGNNLGAAHASGSRLCLLNPDVELAEGWLSPLLSAVDAGAAIAAPVLLDADNTVQSAGHQLFGDGSTAPVTSAPGDGSTARPDYASAACWMLSATTFDDSGGFDESFFPAYYEDVDLALRLRSLGGTVVVGDSSVVHHHGASTADAAVPDTTPQRRHLLAKWPTLDSIQPPAPVTV